MHYWNPPTDNISDAWVTMVMRAWVFSGTESRLLVQFRLVKTTNSSTGPSQMTNKWPFDVKKPKTLPSDHGNAAIMWTWVLWRAMKLDYACVRSSIPHFSYLQSSIPTLWSTLPLYPINTANAHFQVGGFETCSPISLLGCLVNKAFLCCKICLSD